MSGGRTLKVIGFSLEKIYPRWPQLCFRTPHQKILTWSSCVAQQVKYLALSLLQLGSVLWHVFDPCPRNFHLPGGVAKKHVCVVLIIHFYSVLLGYLRVKLLHENRDHFCPSIFFSTAESLVLDLCLTHRRYAVNVC